MATVKGPIQFSGSISNISFYTRRGSDKVIARSKGGASKEKIKNSPKFEGFRKQQTEWKGCTAFASSLRYTFGGLYRLADYNLTPVLNGFAKNVQKTDTEGENGKRNVPFSNYRYTLDGFNFNRNYPFNTVLRVGVTGEISRSTLTATVKVPRINTEIDILNVQRLPYFRLIVALGAISDMHFDDTANSYEPTVPALHGVSVAVTGEWIPSESILNEQVINVSLGDELLPFFSDEVSLVLSVAIEFGKVGFTGEPVEVKYAGCGKVLKVG
jgi:hypothetical protein